MYHMIFISFLLTISSSHAEDFLKCSAVGKANQKCVKDVYPDQEAQESNIISAFEDQFRSAPQSISSGQNPPPSSQYSEQNQSIQGQEYDYGYTVHDETTGDQKIHKESRYNNVVHGSYSLIEPDGSKRTVVYTADDINGFNAVVYIDKTPDILNYNNLQNRNSATFPAEQSEHNIFHSSSHAIPVFDRPSFERNGETYAPAEGVPLRDSIREDPNEQINPLSVHSLETTKFAPAAINLNSLPNIFHHDLSLQQNLPVVVDSFQTRVQENYFSPEDLNSELQLLNQLDDSLVEQTSDNSLIRQDEFSFVSTPSIADQINVEPSVNEGNEKDNNHQISGTPTNPIVMRLLSENFGNFTTDPPSTKGNPSENKSAVNRTDPGSPNHIEEQVVRVNSTTYLPSIMSKNTDYHGRQIVPIGDFHPTTVSTVTERPHQTASFTTPESATEISQQRLSSLSYGEFPLLAHISPSYARRYARHFS